MSMKIYSDETKEFRQVVGRLKTQGMNMTQIAAEMKVHFCTVAGWHCGSIRIPVSRLEQVKGLVK